MCCQHIYGLLRLQDGLVTRLDKGETIISGCMRRLGYAGQLQACQFQQTTGVFAGLQ